MFNKKDLHITVQAEVSARIERIKGDLLDLQQALTDDTKNTAGDKHETSRAMLHLEQERLSGQLEPLKQMGETLREFNPSIKHTTIGLGSLVETGQGIFYLSVGIGAITFQDQKVFCMSTSTPLAEVLQGKQAGDSASFNGQSIVIKSVN